MWADKPKNGSSPIFYGWAIVALSALSMFFSGPGQTYSISIFIDYYIQDFSYSRSFVSGIYSVGTLAAGITLFFVGRAIDRLGQRLVMGGRRNSFGSGLYLECLFNRCCNDVYRLFCYSIIWPGIADPGS